MAENLPPPFLGSVLLLKFEEGIMKEKFVSGRKGLQKLAVRLPFVYAIVPFICSVMRQL